MKRRIGTGIALALLLAAFLALAVPWNGTRSGEEPRAAETGPAEESRPAAGIYSPALPETGIFTITPGGEGVRDGIWHWTRTEETVNALGEPSYVRYRRGDGRKLFLYLPGGGMSVDAHTAEMPRVFWTTGTAWNAFENTALFAPWEPNPFADWTYAMFPCDTADCFVGAGEYTGENGTVLRHRGYENFLAFLDCLHLSPEPESVVLAGSSAGGFGAALLGGVVCERWPEAEITIAVDCSCLAADWASIARDVWGSPEEIREPICSEDCVADALTGLAERYGDRVRILYLAAEHDRVLAAYQNYLDTGSFAYSPEAEVRYDGCLRAAVRRLREEIPGAGIWVCSPDSGVPVPHMLLQNAAERRLDGEGLTVLDWLYRTAVREAEPGCFLPEGFAD